jgi:hypothetical protein
MVLVLIYIGAIVKMTLNLNLQTAKVHVSLSLIDDIIHNVLEIAMKMHLGKF